MAAGEGMVILPLRQDTEKDNTCTVKRKSAIARDEVTAPLNEVCDQIDPNGGDRAFMAAAARRLLKNVEWDSSPDDCTPDEFEES
jgi:hypothetical protein